jgi:hypothetical protein
MGVRKTALSRRFGNRRFATAWVAGWLAVAAASLSFARAGYLVSSDPGLPMEPAVRGVGSASSGEVVLSIVSVEVTETQTNAVLALRGADAARDAVHMGRAVLEFADGSRAGALSVEGDRNRLVVRFPGSVHEPRSLTIPRLALGSAGASPAASTTIGDFVIEIPRGLPSRNASRPIATSMSAYWSLLRDPLRGHVRSIAAHARAPANGERGRHEWSRPTQECR